MKKALLILLVTALALSFAGCQRGTADTSEQNLLDRANENLDTGKQELKDEKVNVKLYFVNQQYVMTGDESLERFIAVEKAINLSDKALGQAVLEELQQTPEDSNLGTSLENIKILSVKVEGNTAFVDFSSQNLSGGSLQESLVIGQVLYTLTELEGISEVQLLIDGNISETLMGHISIDNPFRK